jgi:hypothetical protein
VCDRTDGNLALSDHAIALQPPTPNMSFDQNIAALNRRITNAERERDAWRAVRVEGDERYLEACSNVSALSLQLEGLRGQQSTAVARPPSSSAGHRC